jgi:hypothetical protein
VKTVMTTFTCNACGNKCESLFTFDGITFQQKKDDKLLGFMRFDYKNSAASTEPHFCSQECATGFILGQTELRFFGDRTSPTPK